MKKLFLYCYSWSLTSHVISKLKPYAVLGLVTLSGCIHTSNIDSYSESIKKKQVLTDNKMGADGLAGARMVALTPEGNQLLVASADDNSLAIFNVDSDFHLSFQQIFVNTEAVDGLNGAASLVLSSDGRYAFVASFYDSAIAIFEQDEDGRYQFKRAIRDGLPYDQVFNDDESVRARDKLGLLGAYDIAITSDNTQLFVASVASNALSVFDINIDGDVVFNRAIRDSENANYGLSGAVNLVVTPNNSQVIVAGFYENSLTVFDRNEKGELIHSQTLTNGKGGIENMLAPQGLAMSPSGDILYVACSKSNALVVFAKNSMGKYAFIQSISNADEDISGLGGAGYVSTSSDGNRVYVAAESDNAIVTFDTRDDGMLKMSSVTTSAGLTKEGELNGAASAYVTPDDKNLVVTTGKGDTLIVYRLP